MAVAKYCARVPKVLGLISLIFIPKMPYAKVAENEHHTSYKAIELTAANEAGKKTMVRYDICLIAALSRTAARVSSCIRLLSSMLTLLNTW
jgi:hypothetical protein